MALDFVLPHPHATLTPTHTYPIQGEVDGYRRQPLQRRRLAKAALRLRQARGRATASGYIYPERIYSVVVIGM